VPVVPAHATPDQGQEDADRVQDAALEDLVAHRAQEGRSVRWGLAFFDELAKVHHPAAIGALVGVLAMASTAGAAWRLRVSRLRRRTPMPPPPRHVEDRFAPIS